jgi:hypothetical protein
MVFLPVIITLALLASFWFARLIARHLTRAFFK